MANCPRCGAALKDEYGMSQCPSCGAFAFINMDGHAVAQQESAQASAESVESEDFVHAPPPGGAAAPPDYPDPIENIIDVSSPDMASVASSNDDSSNNEFQKFDPFDSMPSMEAAPSPDSNVTHEFANAEFESIDMSPSASESDFGDEPMAEPEPREPQGFGPASDPLNLNEFANSEVSSAKDGPLLFRVLISGIDTKEMRESIREVLEDPRFAWDSGEIFSKVSKGHLAINGLSPVKASILVTRIKRLPVRVRWEQYAITQGQA